MAISRVSLEKYALNDFYRSHAEKLEKQIQNGMLYLSKHKPSVGSWGEYVLQDFLQQYLSSDFKVTSGFIMHKDKMSHQCDIIVYNPSKSKPIATFGYIEIIPSCAVCAVIEVKTSIRHNTFQKTLKDFKILWQLGVQNKYLFIYSSVLPKTIETYFYDRNGNRNSDDINFFTTDTYPKYDHGDFQYLPTAIVSIRGNYILCQDLVVNNRDMYGYTAYRYEYPNDNKVHSVSSIQLFLGMIKEDCSANNDKSKIDDSHELAFDALQIIYDFGLWDY